MSSGLMSCVRENSPPLELDMNATAGPLSLTEANVSGNMMSGATTSTPMAVGGGSAKTEPSATPNAEQQKRRRFHPLRNLRRIFRRRTITSAADTSTNADGANTAGSSNTLPPSVNSSSEKNLRSATLSAISTVASASSPSSPLTHQQLQESYQTQSLPKSKSYGSHRDELLSAILGKKKRAKQEKASANSTPTHEPNHQYHNLNLNSAEHDSNGMYSATTTATLSTYHQRFQHPLPSQRQSIGIAVFPSAMNRSCFAERQKLRSVGDSSQDLDSSGNESGHNTAGVAHMNVASSNGGEMSDSQRSLSEGRLIDSDFTRDALSQSHDSVFSESATASSLSIVLKAELADVLRKRRNRPDASDEDLGLPRSPASPQRRAGMASGMRSVGGALPSMTMSTPPNANSNTTGDVSSLSLLSMNSTDGEDASGMAHDERRYNLRISTNSTMSMSADILRPHQHEQQLDEVDRVSSERQRLSHSAAKHKMAIRPIKKNVPTRQHRRTLETSIPEANEDSHRTNGQQATKTTFETENKTKTRSMPPIVRVENTNTTKMKATTTTESSYQSACTTSSKQSKSLEQSVSTRHETTATSSTKTTTKLASKESVAQQERSTTHSFGLRALTSKASALFDNRESSTDDIVESESNESGFLRRLMHRNSKRSIAKVSGNDEDDELNQSEPKKLQISTSCMDAVDREPLLLPNKSRSAASYEQNIEDTRKIIRREINNEGKSGLNAMVNTFSLATSSSSSTAAKPKSGPAARQRYLPQELSSPVGTLQKGTSSNSSLDEGEDVISVTNLLSKSSRGSDTFQSTTMVREITAAQQMSTSPLKTEAHFEKKAKIVGLSSFQQKLTRSNESVGHHSNSSNSLETSTDEPSLIYYTEKQRKTVEKSRSFRNYQEERDVMSGNVAGVHNNMPSLPDLSLSFRVPVSYYNDFVLQKDKPATPIIVGTPTSPTEKCVSLGFEINDNKLLKSSIPTTRAESTGHIMPEKNVILTHTASKKSTPAKIGAIMPTISPRNSANISEIEQNIDLIVKSPFVSVLRKSALIGEEPESPTSSRSRSKSPTKQVSAGQKQESKLASSKTHKERPKILELKQTTDEPRKAPMTPTTAAVPLREKSAKASTIVPLNVGAGSENERKSAPVGASTPQSAVKAHSFKSNRRSSSVVDGSVSSGSGSGGSDASDSGTAHVPEFMKIQLNRVDHARLNKSNNVVLAKNVKPERLAEANEQKTLVVVVPTERSYSTDDLSMRRASNDSIEIVERQADAKANGNKNRQPRSAQRQSNTASNYYEANSSKQTRAVSANSARPSSVYSTGSSSGVGSGGSAEMLTMPRSPVKQLASPMQTPTSPVAKSPKKQAISPIKAEPEAATIVTVRTTELAGNAKQQNNKISLEERRRLFLNEDKSKVDKKIEDLRNERKKSITEEFYRKTSLGGGETISTTNNNSNNNNNSNTIAITPTTPIDSPVESANVVVLRKKSFASAQQVNLLNGSASVVSNNNNNNSNTNITNNNNTNTGSDGTPELMKVFARRSLKVKDDDLLVNAIPSVGSANLLKKSTANSSNQVQAHNQSVDSDKENHSASEEKLDKLNKYEGHMETSAVVAAAASASAGSNKISHSSNRNSLADFRNVNNSNNNNNNVNISNVGSPTANSAAVTSPKSYLPPIKVNNMRHSGNSSNNCNNNNNNNNNHNNSQNISKNNNISQSVGNMKAINNERFSVPMKKELLTTTNSTNNITSPPVPVSTVLPLPPTSGTKSIERSATVSEFKGIHQRRAEWEQRAKEALK